MCRNFGIHRNREREVYFARPTCAERGRQFCKLIICLHKLVCSSENFNGTFNNPTLNSYTAMYYRQSTSGVVTVRLTLVASDVYWIYKHPTQTEDMLHT